MKSMRASRKRLSEIDHDYSKASALATMSVAWYSADDPESARATADEGLAVAEGRGFHSVEIICWIIRGWARACLGEPDEGVNDVERGLALAETSGSVVLIPILFVASAHAYRMAKNRDRAEELLDRAKLLDERAGTTPAIVDITFANALIHLDFGDGLPEVENLLLQAVGHADTFETHCTGLRISTQLARIAPQTGRIREAHDRLATHYARLTEGLDRAPVREAKAALDELAEMLELETTES
jgi:predicted ATPase